MYMNLVRSNPVSELESRLNSLATAGRAFARSESQAGVSALRRPAVDIHETAQHYEIVLDVPAVQAKDIQVALKDGVLAVSGERRSDRGSAAASREDAAPETLHRNERRFGRFERSFVLPEDANADAVEANARDGVLTIKVGKRVAAQAKPIAVTAH